MANPITLERFRRQLSACLGRNVTKPIPLTGIEKEILSAKTEQEMAREFWSELTKSFKDDLI